MFGSICVLLRGKVCVHFKMRVFKNSMQNFTILSPHDFSYQKEPGMLAIIQSYFRFAKVEFNVCHNVSSALATF